MGCCVNPSADPACKLEVTITEQLGANAEGSPSDALIPTTTAGFLDY